MYCLWTLSKLVQKLDVVLIHMNLSTTVLFRIKVFKTLCRKIRTWSFSPHPLQSFPMGETPLGHFFSQLKNIFAIICKREAGNTLHNTGSNAPTTSAPSISKGSVRQGKLGDCLRDKSNDIFSKDSVQRRAERNSCWFSVGRDGLWTKESSRSFHSCHNQF